MRGQLLVPVGLVVGSGGYVLAGLASDGAWVALWSLFGVGTLAAAAAFVRPKPLYPLALAGLLVTTAASLWSIARAESLDAYAFIYGVSTVGALLAAWFAFRAWRATDRLRKYDERRIGAGLLLLSLAGAAYFGYEAATGVTDYLVGDALAFAGYGLAGWALLNVRDVHPVPKGMPPGPGA